MLIIEDGSIVQFANSWVDVDAYVDYAELQNIIIDDLEKAERHLIQAQQFITSHENNLKGRKVSRLQYTAFPRTGVNLDSFEVPDNEIPELLKECQMAFALKLLSNRDLYANEVQRITKKEKVDGAVEVEYFGLDKNIPIGKTDYAQSLLNRFINQQFPSFSIIRR